MFAFENDSTNNFTCCVGGCVRERRERRERECVGIRFACMPSRQTRIRGYGDNLIFVMCSFGLSEPKFSKRLQA
jgi:hypothetical protein